MYIFLYAIDQNIQTRISKTISKAEPTNTLAIWLHETKCTSPATHTIPVDAGGTR